MSFSKGNLDGITQMLLWVSEHSWCLPGLLCFPPCCSQNLQPLDSMSAWKVGDPDHIILCLSSFNLPTTLPGAAVEPASLTRAPGSARSCSSAPATSYWASWRFPQSSTKDPFLKYLSSDRRICLDPTCQNCTLYPVPTDPHLPESITHLLFL